MKVEDYKYIEKVVFKEIHRQTKKREKGIHYQIDSVEALIKALRTLSNYVSKELLSWDELYDEPDWELEAELEEEEEKD